MSVRTRFGVVTTVAILGLTGLVVVSELYVSIPLVPTMQQLFGVSQAQASWLGTAFGLAFAGGFLVFGPLSDRYGRKPILVPGLFALALSTLAVGFSPSYEVFIGLRVVQGIAAATFGPAAIAYLGEVLPASIRTTGIAVVTTGFLVAGIGGQVYADAVTLAAGSTMALRETAASPAVQRYLAACHTRVICSSERASARSSRLGFNRWGLLVSVAYSHSSCYS